MNDMKRNIEKYKKIGLVVLAVLLIIVIWNRYRPASKRIKDKFLESLNDYNIMAEIYYEDYQKHSTRIMKYTNAESDNIYCYDYGYEIILSDEEIASCKRACEAYRRLLGRSTDGANVYDTFVSFGIAMAGVPIVYSAKDKRPSYINHPDDGVKPVIVEKITDHWYYVHDNGIVY